MRIMALDYGSKTVGVALSDPTLTIAQPFETITRQSENKLRRTLARIEEIVREFDVSLVVLGLPLNMDGSSGERVERTMEFKEKLEHRLKKDIIFEDERLSTIEAKEILKEMGVKLEDYKKYVDKIAAAQILEDYMKRLQGE